MTTILTVNHSKIVEKDGSPKKIWVVFGPGVTMQRLTDVEATAILTIGGPIPVLETPEQIIEMYNKATTNTVGGNNGTN